MERREEGWEGKEGIEEMEGRGEKEKEVGNGWREVEELERGRRGGKRGRWINCRKRNGGKDGGREEAGRSGEQEKKEEEEEEEEDEGGGGIGPWCLQLLTWSSLQSSTR